MIGRWSRIRAVLKPIFYAGVLQNWGISTSVWTWLTYDAGKAGQFTMSLGVWNVAKDKDPVLGIVFSYNNSAKFEKILGLILEHEFEQQISLYFYLWLMEPFELHLD